MATDGPLYCAVSSVPIYVERPKHGAAGSGNLNFAVERPDSSNRTHRTKLQYPKGIGGVIEDRTIWGTLPTLRLQLDSEHFRRDGS